MTVSIAVTADVDDDNEEATDSTVEAAVAELDPAFSPIERDPELQWQVGGLDSIGSL